MFCSWNTSFAFGTLPSFPTNSNNTLHFLSILSSLVSHFISMNFLKSTFWFSISSSRFLEADSSISWFKIPFSSISSYCESILRIFLWNSGSESRKRESAPRHCSSPSAQTKILFFLKGFWGSRVELRCVLWKNRISLLWSPTRVIKTESARGISTASSRIRMEHIMRKIEDGSDWNSFKIRCLSSCDVFASIINDWKGRPW